MTIKSVYIKERVFGISKTVKGRNVSSSKSTHFEYEHFDELKNQLSYIAGNSSILKMLSIEPHLKYEMSIIQT